MKPVEKVKTIHKDNERVVDSRWKQLKNWRQWKSLKEHMKTMKDRRQYSKKGKDNT